MPGGRPRGADKKRRGSVFFFFLAARKGSKPRESALPTTNQELAHAHAACARPPARKPARFARVRRASPAAPVPRRVATRSPSRARRQQDARASAPAASLEPPGPRPRAPAQHACLQPGARRPGLPAASPALRAAQARPSGSARATRGGSGLPTKRARSGGRAVAAAGVLVLPKGRSCVCGHGELFLAVLVLSVLFRFKYLAKGCYSRYAATDWHDSLFKGWPECARNARQSLKYSSRLPPSCSLSVL